jgi:hypothetical protein
LADTQRRGQKTYDALLRLVWEGLYGTETPANHTEININSIGEFKQDSNSNYYSQEYSVTSARDIRNFNVLELRRFPAGTIITDLNGNHRTFFNSNENFKVMVPKANITENFTGEIIVDTTTRTYPVFYGRSSVPGYQNYGVLTDPYGDLMNMVRLDINAYRSSLNIVKVDDYTMHPIPGVVFNVKYASGEDLGNFTTNNEGKIVLNNLNQGQLIVTEVATDEKFILNTEEHHITLEFNDTGAIIVENEHKKGAFEIIKVDKDNNLLTLGGVQFELWSVEFDSLIGVFTTDLNGKFRVEGLRIGEYILKEVEAKHGYVLGEDTRINVEWDTTIEIVVENELEKIQLEVIKVDEDDNEILLEGVVFHLLDENKNFLEELITDVNGQAFSKRYPKLFFGNVLHLREVETLEDYILLEEDIRIVLEIEEITTITVENEKLIEVEVTVEKEGPTETRPNEIIEYIFSNIANTSNVDLDSFIWTDYLPYEQTKIETLETGTWNQDLHYNVHYSTNLRNEVLFATLHTSENHTLDFTAIELEEGEEITAFWFDFGEVGRGFREVVNPRLYCRVKAEVTDREIITNRTEVIGRHGNITAIASCTWNTIVIVPKEITNPTLPKTGRQIYVFFLNIFALKYDNVKSSMKNR